MKSIRLALVALAAISGIGGAFASSHKKPVGGTTYYAKKSGSQSVWVASKPGGLCNQASALACTITSTSSNVTSLAPNTFPAQYTIVSGSGEARN
jgi:hypothetical protein